MTRNLTEFTFFKDTPLIDFQNTIHFLNNKKRDDHFLNSGHYEKLDVKINNFNYIRDRSEVDIPTEYISYKDFRGVNYASFISDYEPDLRYYAYVMSYEYVNENVVRVQLLIDGIMTFTQGLVLEQLENLTVYRKHLNYNDYNRRIWELKNNDDIIKTNSKSYFKENELLFENYDVIIQSGVDLTKNFGTVDNPIIETSDGLTFDNITSPLNLYVVKQKHFKEFMEKLAPFAWIAQNIRSVILVPENFLAESYQGVSVHSSFGFDHLNELRNNHIANTVPFNNDLKEISYSMTELYDLFGLDMETEKHLLRNEYTTAEVYSWDGQQLFIDLGKLNDETGIDFNSKMVIGFHNEVGIFLRNYKAENISEIDLANAGSFLNDSIIFRNFDDVPILVDNYNLSMAKSANQRELAESRLITNRAETVLDSDADLKDRFFNAASILSNFSITNLFGKFNDEYEFYRQQKAEFADLALETPTITSQTHSNALQMANDFFGLRIKFSKPSEKELNKIKKYYGSFGFELNEYNSNLSQSIRTNTIANYVQFSGSWSIKNVDVALIEQMKAQFENGVRLWHDNNTANPMNQDLSKNHVK